MLARLLGSVRARLIGLILIGAIPVAVLVGQAAVDLYRDADWAARQRMLLVREGVAASHRVVIEVAEQNLAALARSETVLFGSPEQCDSALAEVLSLQEGRSVNIWMTDGAGRLRCSALPAERGVSYAETSWFTEAIRRNQLVLSGFRIGVMTSRRVIVTALPVRRGRDLLGVIAVGLSLDYFAFRTRGTAAAAEAAMWLMDEGGRSFALTDLATDEALPPTAVWAALRRAPITEINAHSVAGSPFFYGAISLAGDLRLLVGVSSKGFEETARRALIRRIIELGALLAACLGAVAVGAHVSVIRPLRQVSSRVTAWRRTGGRFDPGPLRGTPIEVQALGRAVADASVTLAQREEELRAAIASRDLLMAEIHHRVKNNLQIVASLLNLQAGRVRSAEARTAFGAARDRVRALATLHRHLYTHSNFETIALGTFLNELCGQLFEALGEMPGDRIALEVSAPDLTLGSDEAVPLALVITEAVTNAVKYAFPDQRTGTVSVQVVQDGETLTLIVSDDGVGIEAAEDAQASEGLGTMLIQGFARQLGATLTTESSASGTELRLVMPIRGRRTAPGQTEVRAA